MKAMNRISLKSGRPRPVIALLIAWMLGALIACATSTAPPPIAAPPAPHSPLSVLPTNGISLVVYKEARTLAVYREGRMFKRYPVVLGQQPRGSKRFEGDMRTPEGLYRVNAKQRHRRWAYFISFDYPNEDDRRAYARASTDGSLPEIAGARPSIGGALGIHGSDRAREQHAGIDWTKGCVALRNEHVAELYSLVDVGTPVLLLP